MMLIGWDYSISIPSFYPPIFHLMTTFCKQLEHEKKQEEIRIHVTLESPNRPPPYNYFHLLPFYRPKLMKRRLESA